MKSNILESKLRPPACELVIGRERLLENINSANSRRVTVIDADAGYGKTTLMAQMHSLAGNRAIWYQFDELDKGSSSLITHLTAAISSMFPQETKGLQSLIENAANVDEVAGQWIPVLVNNLGDAEDARIFIFLDDFHVINNDDEITALVKFMIAHLPDQCRFAIGSREKPAISLGRLRAQRQVLDIDTRDLTFTPTESRELLSALSPGPVDVETSHAWHQATEGWPIALVMAAALIEVTGSDTGGLLSSLKFSNSTISDFLSEEIWKYMGESMRQVFMEASLMYEVDTRILDQINEGRGALIPANSFFQDAIDRHLMTSCLVSNERYRFHALFKQFLRNKLEAMYSPADLAELHARLGHAYSDIGMYEQAISHLFDAGDIDKAANLLLEHGEAIFQAGKVDTVNKWLKRIPDEKKEDLPMLYLLKARLLEYQGDIEGGLVELAKARHNLNKKNNRRELFLCEFTRSGFLMAIDETENSLEVVLNAQELAHNDQDVVSAMSRAATLHMILGRVDLAMTIWEEAIGRYDDESGRIARQIAIPRISGKFMRGDFKGVLNDTASFFRRDNKPDELRERFIVIFMRSIALFLMARYEQSLEVLNSANDFLGEEHGRYYREALNLLRGRTYLYCDRATEGIRIIKKIRPRHGAPANFGPDSWATYLGSYFRRNGDLDQAIAYHREAVDEMSVTGQILGTANACMELGASLFRLKGLSEKEAYEFMEKAASMAEDSGFSYLKMKTHFYRTLLALENGNETVALDEVGKCLDIASRNWQNHYIAQEGRLYPHVLTFAYKNDVQIDYLLDIFSIIGLEITESLSPLLKSSDAEVRVQAINAIATAGGVKAAPLIYRLLRDKDKNVKEAAKSVMSKVRGEIKDPQEVLTERENEVLVCVSEGISNAEIAERLYISEPTVKTHITRIFQKLGVTKRTQAAAFYHQRQTQTGS